MLLVIQLAALIRCRDDYVFHNHQPFNEPNVINYLHRGNPF